MKKVTAIVLVLIASVFNMKAGGDASENYYGNHYNGSSYIFVEGGVEFSVFPDGQFDFVYLGRNQGSAVNVSIHTPNVSVSYNSGYNYDAFVQYDDYGAVIQIEDVPIYYDEFGRIAQAGSVEIRYNNRRIVRVGGMQVFYNHYGYFSHYSGFISPWYTTYVYRPWHVYYARPIFSHCVVYDYPYRLYYSPVRYSYGYHRAHYQNEDRGYSNSRRDFYRPGSRVHYENGSTAINKNYRPTTGNREIASRGNNESNRQRKNYTASNTRPVSNSNQGRPVNSSRPSMTDYDSAKGRPAVSQSNNAKARPAVSQNGITKGQPVVAQSNNSKGRPAVSQNVTTKGRPVASQSNNTKGRPAVSQNGNTKPRAQRQQSTSRPEASNNQETRKSISKGAQKSGRG